MSKNIYAKSDFKAITATSVYAMVDTLNETIVEGTRNNLIFITTFGYVVAETILKNNTLEKPDNPEENIQFLLQKTLESRNNLLKEYDNEDLLQENTSFLLKNVQIKTFDGHTSNLPMMILFSDSIQGLSLGSLSQ